MPRKSAAPRAPRRIVPFVSGDKIGAQEVWTDRRASNIGNIPSPARVLLVGPCSVGKSTLVKNLIIHQKPAYDEVYVVHLDLTTRDYDDLDATALMNDIPSLEWFNELPERDESGKRIKRAIVLDDLELTSSTKERNKNLAILFRYVSSHRFMTIYMAHQSFFDLPPIVKKMANVFVIYRPRARTELSLIENRVGLAKGELAHLFDTVATGPRDSLMVDFTIGSPAPLRLNIFTPLIDEELQLGDEVL